MVTAASGSSGRCRFSDRGLPVFEASIELRTVHRAAPPRGGIYRWFVPGFPAEQSRIPPEGRPHGGVSELQGNGQLLLRQAIDAAGGFNEDTVTDDLDLSFRLLLAGQPVGSLWDLPVREEAVLGLRVLLRQRQRWAEGGLQRFFDYWPGLISSRLTVAQRCRRRSEGPPLPAMTPLNLRLGILYLGHWFVVIPWTSLRMALRPNAAITRPLTPLIDRGEILVAALVNGDVRPD